MATEKVYKLTIEGTDSVNELKDAIEQLNDKLKTLNETSQEYKETLEELTKLQAQLAEAMENISESAESTSESMESIKDSIADVGEVISDVSDSLDNLGNFDSGAIDAFVEGFVDGLTDAINSVDGIEEKLDEIQDVDVNVNVDVDGGSIEALNDALDNIEDADVKVNVDVNQDSIGQLKETLDGIDDVNVKVNVETDESSIEGLTDTLENIDDVTVSVNVEANDNSVEELKENLDSIEDTDVKVNVDVDDSSIDTLTTTLDSLEDVDIEVNVKTDENPIENLSATLENLEDADVSVTVDVNENSLDSLTTTLDSLEDTTVSVNVTTDEGSVEDLKETLENIEDVNVTVGVEVDDSSLDNLTTTLENVEDANINVGVEVSDEQLDNLSEDITNITTDFESLNSEAEKTSETLGNIGGASTVKELKQEISDFRDRLVTLDKGSDEYKATVQELIDDQVKLKEVMNAGKNEIQAAEGSYNALSQRMSALKQVWKETTDEATRNEIGKQINEINNQLKALDTSIGNSQRNVGNYQSALDGVDGSFVKWKQELRECKEAMEQLDPETQEYADAMARAAELTHNLSDQQEMIKYSSADFGDQLDNVRGIASNLAAGYSAVNAAMGLFGQENEEVQQAMLKVQQAMALVQGLQGIDGFIKRTQGLSQSLGLVTKATKAQTVAIKANATATKQDAVAKGVEATATAGVIPAQLGLNAAMKANPIGFIIGLIASLIAIFSLLKDKIMEMIGANEEMSAAFDKVKAVLAGFGNVIKKSVINPVKLAIIPIKTLAKAMIDLFNRDWSAIGDDIKEGFTEMKDNVVDTINVVGAFKEGYDKKTAEQNEAARKKEAEARAKELDDIIKDNEAKYKSDWKYTEEGEKAYREYFKKLMEMYDENTEEYKQAQRDQWAFDRDLSEHQEEEDEKRNTASKKAAEDVAKERKKILEDNLKSMEKAYTDYLGKFKNYMDDISKFIIDVQDEYREKFSRFVVTFKDGTNTVTRNLSDLKTYLVDSMNVDPRVAEQFIDGLVKEMEKGKSEIEAIVDGKSVWFTVSDQFTKTLREEYGFTQKQIDDIFDHINEEITKADYDRMVKPSLDAIEKEFYNFDRAVKQVMSDVKAEFDLKDAISGITIPYEAIAHTENMFTMLSQNVRREIIKVEDEIDRVFSVLTTNENSPFFGKTKEQIGELIPSFQKLLDKLNELNAEEKQLELEKFRDISDIWKQDWENRINIVKEGNQAINDANEQGFKEQINNAMRWQGVYGNALRDAYEDKAYDEKVYKEKKGQLKRLLEMYNEMANDERLTFEEKENAKREAAKVTGELIQLEYDNEVNRLKNQKALIKEWANAFKDAFSGLGDIFSTMNDYYTGLMELEQMKIDKQLEDKKINEEQAHALYEQQRENFDKSKNMQLAMTWINGFSAAIGAYQSMASIPYVGPILGAAAAAAALATTAVQAAKIKQTTMDNPYGGGESGGGGSTNFQLPNVMEMEPSYLQNQTNMNDTDDLNNDGSGRGRGDRATRVILVESDVTEAQNKANKRKTEVTF